MGIVNRSPQECNERAPAPPFSSASHSSSDMMAAALGYARLGIPVFPCNPDKKPYIKGGFHAATCSVKQIAEWWTRWPLAMIGMPTGAASGVFVVDLDLRDEGSGFDQLPDWASRSPTISSTPSGGAHLYFARGEEPFKNTVNRVRKVDTRGDGGYVILPPSRRGDGVSYRWLSGNLDDRSKLPPIPPDLKELLFGTAKKAASEAENDADADDETEPVEPSGGAPPEALRRLAKLKLTEACNHLASMKEGARNDTLNRFAFRMGQFVGAKCFDEKEVLGCLSKAAKACGLPDDETQLTLGGGVTAGMQKPALPKLLLLTTDHMGRAEIFRRLMRPNIRRWRGDFYDWDGGRYTTIADADLAAEVAKFLNLGHARHKELILPFEPSTKLIDETITMLRHVNNLPSTADPPFWTDGRREPDTSKLLALANGLLNLGTRQLLPATPDLFVHQSSSVEYDPAAPEPVGWCRFLVDIFGNDKEQIDLLQEIFGYALMPGNHLQKIFLLIGPPRSGKGTIATVLRSILAEGSVVGPMLSSLTTNFGLQPLIGAQLAVVDDVRIGKSTDRAVVAERLLTISGGGLMTIDRKNRDAWIGVLTIKFLLISNQLPQFKDDAGAVASRFVALETRHSFYGREDPDLAGRLLGERCGILRWALAGAQRLLGRGRFPETAASREMGHRLRISGSNVQAFIEDRCIFDPAATVPKKVLYDAYAGWCEANGQKKPAHPQFSEYLFEASRGQVSAARPTENGKRVWHYRGIRLLKHEEDVF